MIHTRNGGRHWQDLSDQFLQKVHFFDDSHGDGAVVTNFLRTSDGGLSWTTAKIPHVRFIDRILFLTPDIGWLAGTDGKDFIAFRTINGGRDWEESRTAAPKGIVLVRDLFFLDRERGWLITWQLYDGGTYLYSTVDGGKTWAPQGGRCVLPGRREMDGSCAVCFTAERIHLSGGRSSGHSQSSWPRQLFEGDLLCSSAPGLRLLRLRTQ